MPKEVWYDYPLKITFNFQSIKQVTITSHYQEKHNKAITDQLILKLLKKLDGEQIEPTNYQGSRKPFRIVITYQEKKYRLIFWFKDHTPNHLWIRNCYPID